ncbi:MAG: hypothetical protein ACYC10_15545 [Allorhizobium sp.]
MFAKFKYETIPLSEIILDPRNPRIVSQERFEGQEDILKYFFENEDLLDFIKKIANEGRNIGAERPYLIKQGDSYVAIEGNTRIAAYKVLTGLAKPPKEYESLIPDVSDAVREKLLHIESSIAPSRDDLLSIMANAHFGEGDKSKWGYLGSRKAVFDEWAGGRTIPKIAKAFGLTQAAITDLILEYKLYLKALELDWSTAERAVLQKPSLAFNPPVRFLQGSGHKEKIGIEYDRTNLEIVFTKADTASKFKHLIKKLVVAPQRGLGAVASYDDVFADYLPKVGAESARAGTGSEQSDDRTQGPREGDAAGKGEAGEKAENDAAGAEGGDTDTDDAPRKFKPNVLFSYDVRKNNKLLHQLMKEGNRLNCKSFPAAGTFLLRNIVEATLRDIIDQSSANQSGSQLDLGQCLSICQGKNVTLSSSDRKILKEFMNNHLEYLNLGAHGTLIPNFHRLIAARDCIDQFIKRNV